VARNHHQPFHGYYFAMLTKQGSDAPGGAKDYIATGKMTGLRGGGVSGKVWGLGGDDVADSDS
jgi:hypothetical protein